MENFLAVFISSFVPIAGALITALVAWGTVELTKFIRAKTKNEAAYNAVGLICDLVETTVAELNQTMVPAMQEMAADGKLTKKDAVYLKNLAVEKIKAQIPPAIEQAATLAMNSIPDFVSAEVEKAVGETKTTAS